jgi:hypothetical protein
MPAAAAWINPSVETNEVGTPGVVSLSETFLEPSSSDTVRNFSATAFRIPNPLP